MFTYPGPPSQDYIREPVTTPPFIQPNPWLPFLEDNPQALYTAMLNQRGGSNNFLNYWNKNFSNVQDKYMGSLGTQILGGQSPTTTFKDWLENQFNFGTEWNRMAPWARGVMPTTRANWNLGY